MNTFRLSLIALAGTLMCGAAAAAETPVLDKRQENQEARIQQGVENRQLNKREEARLERAEDRLEANEAKAKEDGKVTARERLRLQREAEANSARIYRQKHDRQQRKGDRPAKSSGP